MRFSVIIPLYNKDYSIERCVNSVLIQGDLLGEIVIVDDGSNDRSLEIVQAAYHEELRSKKIVLISKENEGVSIARNVGVMSAKNDLICFIDADDEWKAGFLEHLSRLISDFPEAILYSLGHAVKLHSSNEYKTKRGLPEGYRGYVNNFFRVSAKASVVNSSTACVRKAALEKIGGFPPGVVAGEDIYVWARLALCGRVACDTEILAVIHRENDASRTARDISVPYPLVYFSKNNNIARPKDFNKYIFVVFAKHFLYSLSKGKLKEAFVRLYYFARFWL